MLCPVINPLTDAVQFMIDDERPVDLQKLLSLLDRMLEYTPCAGFYDELLVRAFPCVPDERSYEWGCIVAKRSARTDFARRLWAMLEDNGLACVAWNALGTSVEVRDEVALVQHALPRHLGFRTTVPGTAQARLVATMFAEQMSYHGFDATFTGDGHVSYRQRDQAFSRDCPAASQALQPGPWCVFYSRGSVGAPTAYGHVVRRSLRGAAVMRQLPSVAMHVEVSITDAFHGSGFPFCVNASDLPEALAAAAGVRCAA